ncbi:MAG: hypothetical protein K2X55_10180, partial [Burkholderiaceae bacterium]|nr:hypothetical protein [Burkholderiaceae bacterium]
GPDDFKRLLFTFGGAGGPKTLKEWITYARNRGLKIHSWLADWKKWVDEVGSREPPRHAAAAVVPEPHKPKALRQEELILQCIRTNELDPQRLPRQENGHSGVKAKIWKIARPNTQILPSRTAFDKAWQRLRDAKQIGEDG